jgi:hypothetical protein
VTIPTSCCSIATQSPWQRPRSAAPRRRRAPLASPRGTLVNKPSYPPPLYFLPAPHRFESPRLFTFFFSFTKTPSPVLVRETITSCSIHILYRHHRQPVAGVG